MSLGFHRNPFFVDLGVYLVVILRDSGVMWGVRFQGCFWSHTKRGPRGKHEKVATVGVPGADTSAHLIRFAFFTCSRIPQLPLDPKT